MRIFNYTDMGDYMEDKKKGWVVRVGEAFFIKRTSQFGAFHGGTPRLTVDRDDARVWTREKDAAKKASIYMWRVATYKSDASLPKTAKHEPR